MTVWPLLMGLSGLLALGGWAFDRREAKIIGGVMFVAYVAMQAKKLIYPGLEGHAVSMLIWSVAAATIMRVSLKFREKYGISPIYPCAALLLVSSGTCYLWARMAGRISGYLVPHAITADLLALVAMILAGSGVIGDVVRSGGRVGVMVYRNFGRG